MIKKQIILILLSIFIGGSFTSLIEAKPIEETYAEKLAQLKPDDADGYYQLGLWCLKNKLNDQAKMQFNKVVELNPNHEGARKNLGYVKYEGKWMSSEELQAKGLAFYKGKWMPYDEAMKVQGYIKYEDQWITQKEYDFLKDISKKLASPKGVLDKPGADFENLPWDEAREKETDHFIVRTNLSVDALNDICFLMEYAYFTWQGFFGAYEHKAKRSVWVVKNRVEFEKTYKDWTGRNPPRSSCGLNSGKGQLVYYNPGYSLLPLSGVLLHEGTHYAQQLTIKYLPGWCHEGLATYFEGSKIEGKRLITNRINPERLPRIKEAISKKTYIKLNIFINVSLSEYPDNLILYAEGWSLIYFLINSRGGKYKDKFKAYIETWKGGKIDIKSDGRDSWIQDKDGYINRFEQVIGVPIDDLEKEWKEYILSLK
jgi:tetratricopeptide (TPR) repeat protein